MAQWLTVVLPGRNYGPIGATLRMPVLVLENDGAKTAVIDYALAKGPRTIDDIAATAREQVTTLLKDSAPTRVTFVAKSLGTAVLATLDSTTLAGVRVEAIWLTPLFNEPSVRTGAINSRWRSLLAAGDADPYHDSIGFDEVRRALDAESLVVPGADHGLEIPSNPEATVDVLRNLVDAVRRFVAAPR